MSPEGATLSAIRRLLLFALVAGCAGTLAELLLIGHFEDPWQFVPLALLGVGLLIAIWHAAAPGLLSTRLVQLMMAFFVISGAAGVVLHYRGNQEFALEMQSSLAGWPLVQEVVTGATPVLAPGSMTLLGLIGFAAVHRHPASRRGGETL
jgi:hypothetical protein